MVPEYVNFVLSKIHKFLESIQTTGQEWQLHNVFLPQEILIMVLCMFLEF